MPEKIAETGVIAIGYDVSSPCSFPDGPNGQPIGYTIEIDKRWLSSHRFRATRSISSCR